MRVKPTVLPETKLVGIAGNSQKLASLLKKAVRESVEPFRFRGVVKGLPVSCRFISHERMKGLMCLREPLSSIGMAETFFNTTLLGNTKHGDVPEGVGWVKGWRVSRADINGHVLVVLMATWVKATKSR